MIVHSAFLLAGLAVYSWPWRTPRAKTGTDSLGTRLHRTCCVQSGPSEQTFKKLFTLWLCTSKHGRNRVRGGSTVTEGCCNGNSRTRSLVHLSIYNGCSQFLLHILAC